MEHTNYSGATSKNEDREKSVVEAEAGAAETEPKAIAAERRVEEIDDEPCQNKSFIPTPPPDFPSPPKNWRK